MSLNKARILSSENDASVKQSQETNVEINIKPNQQPISQPISQPVYYARPSAGTESAYPSIPQMNHQPNPQTQTSHSQVNTLCPASKMLSSTSSSAKQPSSARRDINFTIPEDSQSPYQPPINNIVQESPDKQAPAALRGISDLGNHIVAEGEARNELETLELKNKFLELLVEMYEDNPLKINSYVVCKSSLLMNMIKLLTNCDKVDFVLEDEEPGCCLANVSKMIKIDKILITKDGKSEELKYCYNNIYTEFVKYGISLKLCV